MDEWAYLAVAQHHGLATRLLDWTENILVACYFAVDATQLGDPPVDSAIYALPRNEVEYIDTETPPFSTSNVKLFYPKHFSPRITAQQGLFTIHENPYEAFDSSKLEKWVIDVMLRAELEATIKSYGIDTSTVFPDLDGLAKQINLWCIHIS